MNEDSSRTTPRRRATDAARSGVKRAGRKAAAGVRNAAAAWKRARAWRPGHERREIPESTIPALPPGSEDDLGDALEALEDSVRRHPIGMLAAGALVGYVVGRLLD